MYANESLDTALIFGLIERYGWDFISRIHGMFAIALYNSQEGVMRLYRDPSGQKLLYYYEKDGRFLMSSEIRGLIAAGGIDRTVDTESISVAAALGYIPGDKTIYAHIKKLPPSTVLTYDLKTQSHSVSLYESHAPGYFPDDLSAACRQLVDEHLQSKAKIAINLSGGLDSSMLLHEIAGSGRTIDTYSTSFEGEVGALNDDAEIAARLATDYGATHHPLLITKEAYRAVFRESYATIEEPNFNISVPVYYLTARHEGITGDRNRVMLSGDGGDEVFGGYPHYLRNRRDDLLIKLYGKRLFNAVRNLRNHTDNLDFSHPSDRWYFYKFFREQHLGSVPEFSVSSYARETANPYLAAYAPGVRGILGSMLMDRIMWLAGENFIRSDKLYMSQSIEMRCPLSYHPFREYLDARLTDRDYIDQTANKIALRRHYAGRLPDYVTKRTSKTGWRAPVSAWYDQDMKKLFLEEVSAARSRSVGLIDWIAIERQIEATDAWPGKQMHFYVSLATLANAQGLAL